MDHPIYPHSGALAERKRGELAPKQLEAFHAFSASVFADGALPGKTKQLIAVAVAHVTQCPYCVRGHTKGSSAPRQWPRAHSPANTASISANDPAASGSCSGMPSWRAICDSEKRPRTSGCPSS